MRLLIISHTPHHRKDGQLVGWGPTVREIDQLAGLFAEVVHVAPLHKGPAPSSELPYESPNVQVVSVPPAGGLRLTQKLRVIALVPRYVLEVWRHLNTCDVVHVRCPCNIGLVTLFVLVVRRTPLLRWVKYAGNWEPHAPRRWSYSLQRWLLARGFARALVTVNGEWPDQQPHVHAFRNPCLTDDELHEAALIADGKDFGEPVRLLFVGRLDDDKGCGRALEVLDNLKARGVNAVLDIVGDGPGRPLLEARALATGLGAVVCFTGWLPQSCVAAFYAKAHCLLLPSNTEGWPKVLSEGMAFGVVPIAGAVSSIPQVLSRANCGITVEPSDVAGFASAVVSYMNDRARWKRESANAREAAKSFSYSAYLSSVRFLLGLEKDAGGRLATKYRQQERTCD